MPFAADRAAQCVNFDMKAQPLAGGALAIFVEGARCAREFSEAGTCVQSGALNPPPSPLGVVLQFFPAHPA